MATKRQTTMAKLQRERRVQEKRERKIEKKQAAAAAKALGHQPPTADETMGPDEPGDEPAA